METTIQEYSPTEAALADLRKKYAKTVYDVSTVAGMNAAKVARKEISTYRIDLEKLRKEIKAPALDRCRQIDDEAKRITAELVALEDPIDHTITEEENRLKAVQAEKVRLEAERRQGIMTKIARFRGVAAAMASPSNTSEIIKDTLQKVEDALIDEAGYNEFLAEAVEARKQAVDALIDLIKAVEEREAEQLRIKAEREELEELRRQNAERLAKEQKEQDDRLAREREAQEKERLHLQKEQDDRLALERETLRKENEATQEKLRLENEALEKLHLEQAQQAIELKRKEEELAAQKKQQEMEAAAHLDRVKKLQAAKKDTPVTALIAILELAKSEEGRGSVRTCWMTLDQIIDLAEANLPVDNSKKPGPGKSAKVSK